MIHLLVGTLLACVALGAPFLAIAVFLVLQEENEWWETLVGGLCVGVVALCILALCGVYVYAGVRCAIWGFW